MINIKKLSGEHFISINGNYKNKMIDYNEMKNIFESNIMINSYYMITCNNENIYTNLYDIYEMKYKKDIILDDMYITILPYNKNDVDNLKKSIGFYGFITDNFNFPNETLKADKLFVLMAVNYSGAFYKKIADELRDDEQIIYNAALSDKYKFECLNYIPIKYKQNKEFMKFFISINGSNIKFVSDDLKTDNELINLAINNKYGGTQVLEYLSESSKDNEDIVNIAINNNPKCFKYISDRLKNDKQIIMKCIEKLKLYKYKYNDILKMTSYTIKNNKEIVLELMKIDGFDIRYISQELFMDKQVVITAIQNDSTVYKHIDKSFLNDKEIVMLCLNNDKYDEENFENFLEYLNYNFQNDKEIVMASIKKCGKNIIYASKKLRNDKEIVLSAIDNCYYPLYEDMDEKQIIFNIKQRYKNINIILKNTKLRNNPDILKHIINKIKI